MSRQFQSFFRNHTEADQNKSFKTLRSATNYNLSDFLPPTKDQSSSQVIILRPKEKLATQVGDKYRQSLLNQQIRKNQILEQEKTALKVELDSAKKQIESMGQHSQSKDRQMEEMKRKIEQLKACVKQPKLSYEKNSIYFQHFPIFRQSYQVSVQTDPVIETSHMARDSKGTSGSSNSQMQHIYQKLESLKMSKRKQQVLSIPQTTIKTERPRAITSNWGSNDKENVMRGSNLVEKGVIHEKKERVRDQTLDIYPMSLEMGERLLKSYLDEPFL